MGIAGEHQGLQPGRWEIFRPGAPVATLGSMLRQLPGWAKSKNYFVEVLTLLYMLHPSRIGNPIPTPPRSCFFPPDMLQRRTAARSPGKPGYQLHLAGQDCHMVHHVVASHGCMARGINDRQPAEEASQQRAVVHIRCLYQAHRPYYLVVRLRTELMSSCC